MPRLHPGTPCLPVKTQAACRGLSGHGSSQEVCVSPADAGLRSNAFFSLADQPSLPASVGVYRTPSSALGVTSCRLTPEEGSARIACHVPGRAGCSLLARLLPVLPAACPLRDEEAYTGGVAERAHLEDEGVPGDRSQGAHGLRGMDPSVSRSSSVWSSPWLPGYPVVGKAVTDFLSDGSEQERAAISEPLARPAVKGLVDEKLLTSCVVPGREFLEGPCLQSSRGEAVAWSRELGGIRRTQLGLCLGALSACSSFPLEEVSALRNLTWGPGLVHSPFCFPH